MIYFGRCEPYESTWGCNACAMNACRWVMEIGKNNSTMRVRLCDACVGELKRKMKEAR